MREVSQRASLRGCLCITMDTERGRTLKIRLCVSKQELRKIPREPGKCLSNSLLFASIFSPTQPGLTHGLI